jgi:SAM-dependent methyltransferase
VTTSQHGRPPNSGRDPYAAAVRTGRGPLYLRLADGRRVRLPVHRWCAQPDEDDHTLLEGCEGPVLDVGCGPGRLCTTLLHRGVFAVGIDIARHTVNRATALGGAVLCRSVFEPLPLEGRWQTVLLADGNIGIGGDPAALLRRCAHLASPTGTLLIEADQRDIEECCTAWFEDAEGYRGPPFPWAGLGTAAICRVAERLGLSVIDQWRSGHRAFVSLAPQHSHHNDGPRPARRVRALPAHGSR